MMNAAGRRRAVPALVLLLLGFSAPIPPAAFNCGPHPFLLRPPVDVCPRLLRAAATGGINSSASNPGAQQRGGQGQAVATDGLKSSASNSGAEQQGGRATELAATTPDAWLHLPRVNKSDPSVRRLRATIAYDGKGFYGVQKNRGADGAPLRTILETLESALWPVLGQRAIIVAAGRTDSGVSASGQVVCFDASLSSSPAALADAFNARLPPDLRVRALEAVPPGFDVVRDCRWKRYRYRLPGPDETAALRVVVSHAARTARARQMAAEGGGCAAAQVKQGRRKAPCPPLADVEAMRAAAALFEGTHDFEAFQSKGGDQMGTVRTVFRCSVEERGDGGGFDMVVEGDGFLYKQVRLMAGTLAQVGMGLASPQLVASALESPVEAAGEAAAAGSSRHVGVGPTMPAEWLCLERVEYDQDHSYAV